MGDAVDTTMKHVLRVCATVAVLVTAGAASTQRYGAGILDAKVAASLLESAEVKELSLRP